MGLLIKGFQALATATENSVVNAMPIKNKVTAPKSNMLYFQPLLPLNQPTMNSGFFLKFKWLFLLLFISSASLAQNSLEASIQVGDNKLKPIANIEVMLMEQSTRETMKARTNAEGKANFSITTGIRWNIYIAGALQQPEIIEVPQDGGTAQQEFYFTFDPALEKRLKQQSFERKNLQEVKIEATSIGASPVANFFIAHITITNSDKVPLINKKVSMVCHAQKKAFIASTNTTGIAAFQLPINNQYDIDVEDQLNAGFLDNSKQGVTSYKTLVYDAYDMVESKHNDTIVQKIKLPIEAKNSKALFRLKMKRSNGKVSNENVFLDEIQGAAVYKAKTDQNGKAYFLLPFGKKFMLHFNYQRDVDVVDFTDARGSAEGSLELTYRPDPELEFPERFVPKVGELVLTDFEHYHKTPYPKPNDISKPAIFLRWGNKQIPSSSKESILEIGLSSMFMQDNARLPLNLSFVVDISGSMAGHERIESLKEGLVQLVQKLSGNDIISIILFDDNMQLLLPAQKIGNAKNSIVSLIKNIQPSGGTNMLKAMKAGYEEVLKHYNTNSINAVILLTDGFDSNPVDVLIKAQEPYNNKITCMGIGVGNNYNYDLMKQLVSKGSGLLHFAEGQDLVDLFSYKLIKLAAPVAKNINIEINFQQPLVCKKLYGANKVQMLSNTVKASLPDLYLGTEKPLLAQFTHAITSAIKTMPPVTIVVNYTNPSTGKQEKVSSSIALDMDNTTASKTKLLVTDEEQKKMYAVAFANECLTNMSVAFGKGNIVEARRQIQLGLTRLRELYPSTTDKDILALMEKMNRYQTACNNLAHKNKLEKL
jgi:Ca-activated chloride channel family protein